LNSKPLQVLNLRKSFDSLEALKGISFEVNQGEIFGLIGPNGAGKTTTLRIVSGLLKPDSGEVRIYGLDPFRDDIKVKRIISYLPEDAGVYRHLRGIDFLEFIARVYAENEGEARSMVERAVEMSGLGDRLRDPMRTYSKGMKRRLLLAATLMTKPRLAILDEPTSGLDVYHSVVMRKLIRSYVEETNAAILLSSHNMLEVEYLCDKVAFINEGRIIAIGRPRELRELYNAENLEEAFIRAVEEVKVNV